MFVLPGYLMRLTILKTFVRDGYFAIQDAERGWWADRMPSQITKKLVGRLRTQNLETD